MCNDHVANDRATRYLTADEIERAKARAHKLRNEAMRGALGRLGGLLIGVFWVATDVAADEGTRRGDAHQLSC